MKVPLEIFTFTSLKLHIKDFQEKDLTLELTYL